MARADATCPKVAAQASLKYWAPAVCPPIFPGLHRLGPPCTPGRMGLSAPESRAVASAQLAPHWSGTWHTTHLGPCGPGYGHPYVPEAEPRELLTPHQGFSPQPVCGPVLAHVSIPRSPGQSTDGHTYQRPLLPAAQVPHPSPGGRAGSRHLGVQARVSSRGPRPEHLALTLAPRVSETPSMRLSASRLQLLRPEPTWCLPSPRPRARRPDLELPSPHRCAPTPSPGPPALQPTGPSSQPAHESSRQARHILPRNQGHLTSRPCKAGSHSPCWSPVPERGVLPHRWACPWLSRSPVPPHRGWGFPPAPGWGTPEMPGSLSAGTRAGPPGDCSVVGGRPPSGYGHRSPPPRGAWHPWVSAKRPSGAP